MRKKLPEKLPKERIVIMLREWKKFPNASSSSLTQRRSWLFVHKYITNKYMKAVTEKETIKLLVGYRLTTKGEELLEKFKGIHNMSLIEKLKNNN